MSGRPCKGEERKLADSLLSAAERCWQTKQSHLDVTSGEIAELAGTHAGMVNYYYGNKYGIFSALIDSQIAKTVQRLKQIETAVEANAGDPTEITEIIVRGLFEVHYPYAVDSHHSEKQSIVLVEILRHGSPIREAYIRRGGSRTFSRITKLVQNLVDKGVFKQGLDPAATTQMILSLISGSYVLAPLWRLSDRDAKAIPLDREQWLGKVIQIVRKEVAAP